jgi:Phage integrase central domain/Arm DNA-binding domain
VLSAKKVDRTTKDGRYSDHGGVPGLYLQVSRDGKAKSWILRYQIDHTVRWMGLGSAKMGGFTLKQARERATEARQKLADRIDPLDLRNAERDKAKAVKDKALTFAQAAQQYYAQHEAEWTNRKHAAQFMSSLTTYAFDIIGNMDVAAIDTAAVLRVLEQNVPSNMGSPAGVFWQVRTTTAGRVRNRIELVLDWATVREHRPKEAPNPARWKGHLDQVLAKCHMPRCQR